jgi:hypothetical protein
VVLRVDALKKLGGTACEHQVPGVGCGIYDSRPAICRSYRCLWLQGGLRDGDRPDRLGALLDLVSAGGAPRLAIHEASAGAFERSPRLQEIAAEYRRSMPVRVTLAQNVLDADRGYRELLPDGSELRIRGDRVETWREGRLMSTERMPWLERLVRRVVLWAQAQRVRGYRGVVEQRAHQRRMGRAK